MTDFQYSRTESLIEAIKSKSGKRLFAALLEEESSFSMHVFKFIEGKIIMNESKQFQEEEFLEEYECGYWVVM